MDRQKTTSDAENRASPQVHTKITKATVTRPDDPLVKAVHERQSPLQEKVNRVQTATVQSEAGEPSSSVNAELPAVEIIDDQTEVGKESQSVEILAEIEEENIDHNTNKINIIKRPEKSSPDTTNIAPLTDKKLVTAIKTNESHDTMENRGKDMIIDGPQFNSTMSLPNTGPLTTTKRMSWKRIAREINSGSADPGKPNILHKRAALEDPTISMPKKIRTEDSGILPCETISAGPGHQVCRQQ
ncbi:hypothetical protein ACOSQ3_017683 [Xanthoceras sorbifolium]